MKTRIISAAILVPILFLLVLVAPVIVAAIVMGVLLAIAAYELLYRTGLVKHPRLVIYACVMAFAVCLWSYFDARRAYFEIILLVFWLLLFSEMMLDHVKIHFEMLAMCFTAGVVIPYMLSSLIRILNLDIGRYVILIPFVVAFMSDTGAYFVGLKFGHHKLAPVVSPNKTIEGAVGGVVLATVSMLVYALILDLLPGGLRVNYGLALLYGFAGSLIGIFGDLSFSAIKRQTGVKDYGNLIPGHGGVLDRFDSVTTVAPVMEILLLLLPIVR
ncbi:MAG: phosphatidate cytidylyltransferase [Firmicutes bacterium]|nr:phosphatidate cytidylyltransferase [Bacillota bacterium]